MRIARFSFIMISLLCIVLVLSMASAQSSKNGAFDLYRVYIGGHEDAARLTSLPVDPLLRVAGGYLVLATDRGEKRLAESGLRYELIATGVDRSHLAMDIRHDNANMGKYPAIFDENRLRIFRIDNPYLIAAGGSGLASLRTEAIPVTYYSPPRLDKTIPVSSDDLDSLINRVREDSLLSYSEYLQSFDGRLTATAGNFASATWLRDKFIEFGYDSVVFDTFTADIYGSPEKCRNVIAYKVGTEYPYYHIIVGAHRDAVEFSPGADDNGSGTAGVLEIARALRDVETKYTFVFILFDAEEQGLHGSWHYAEQAFARDDRIMHMLNMDMIAHYENDSDANIYYYFEDDVFGQLWASLADSIPSIGINAYLWSTSGGGGSDHAPFMQYGYDAMFVQEYVFSTVYHDPNDSTTYMNFDYMARMVKASAATLHIIDRQFIPDYELYMAAADGFPAYLIPNTPTQVHITVREYGGAHAVPGSVALHYSVNGGDVTTLPMTAMGGDLYAANLPALPCLDKVKYIITAEDDSLGTVSLPATGDSLVAVSATGLYSIFEDDFETDKGWSVTGNASNIGEWERGEPDYSGFGLNDDYDGNGWCFVTGISWMANVNDGLTTLLSPLIEIAGQDVLVQYARWYFNDYGGEPHTDVFEIYISQTGSSGWIPVETVGPVEQASGNWYIHRFWISDFITPSTSFRLRFDASDYGADTYVKAAIDDVKMMTFETEPRIITEYLSPWTASHPYSEQLIAAVCDDSITWADRFGQLDETGLTLSVDGMLAGVPTRVGPVVFTAQITGQSGGYDEKRLSFIVYDSLRITTAAIPSAAIDETYSYQLQRTGGTGDKIWFDRDGGLAETGITLGSDGLLSGTTIVAGDFPFVAQVVDEVGAVAERTFTMHIVGLYVCGDASGDGTVNIGDAVWIISYVFSGGPAPYPIESGDANADGDVTVADAVYIINFVFKGGPEPRCP